MHWLWANKEWIFSGAGITALAALVWAVRRAMPSFKRQSRGALSAPPPVDNPLMSTSQPGVAAAAAFSPSPTPFEISERLKALPPYQQHHAMTSYEGIAVSWPVRFHGMDRSSGDFWTVHFTNGDGLLKSRGVFAEVNLADAPRLKIAKSDDEMILNGLSKRY